MLEDFITKATSTATLSRAYDLDYLVPGLAGEVGEAYGKRAKGYRDGWNADHAVAQELGDVAWFTAMLIASTRRHTTAGAAPVHTDGSAVSLLQAVTDLVDDYYTVFDRDDAGVHQQILADAHEVWATLTHQTPILCGYRLLTVLNMNTTKLLSRANRGVLSGSGDNR